MNRRALHPDQALDARGHIEQAIAQVRACIDLEPSCGPLLVAAYRALSALGELREVVDGMPALERERT